MILRTLRARGTFLQECFSQWVRRANLLQIESPFQSCETNRFVKQLGQLTTSCRKCTKQMFTSSQILFYVWKRRRCTCQKSSSPKDGKSISSTARTPQGELMGNKVHSNSTYFLVPKCWRVAPPTTPLTTTTTTPPTTKGQRRQRREAVGSPVYSQSRQAPQEHDLHQNFVNMVASWFASVAV